MTVQELPKEETPAKRRSNLKHSKSSSNSEVFITNMVEIREDSVPTMASASLDMEPTPFRNKTPLKGVVKRRKKKPRPFYTMKPHPFHQAFRGRPMPPLEHPNSQRFFRGPPRPHHQQAGNYPINHSLSMPMPGFQASHTQNTVPPHWRHPMNGPMHPPMNGHDMSFSRCQSFPPCPQFPPPRMPMAPPTYALTTERFEGLGSDLHVTERIENAPSLPSSPKATSPTPTPLTPARQTDPEGKKLVLAVSASPTENSDKGHTRLDETASESKESGGEEEMTTAPDSPDPAFCSFLDESSSTDEFKIDELRSVDQFELLPHLDGETEGNRTSPPMIPYLSQSPQLSWETPDSPEPIRKIAGQQQCLLLDPMCKSYLCVTGFAYLA